jgi:hypothetical protein
MNQHIQYFHNPDNGRAADVSRDTSGRYAVHMRNGNLFIDSEFDIDSKDEALETAQDFINGRVTNVEMIVRLMERANSGPLIQGFVVEALGRYADQVKDAAPEQLGGVAAFINPDAWRACAQEVSDTLKKHLEN